MTMCDDFNYRTGVRRGAFAFHAGMARTDNPYPVMTAGWYGWLSGFERSGEVH